MRRLKKCIECHCPVAHGGNRHKKGFCPPGKRSIEDQRALDTAAHGIIICELGVTKIEAWERELRRNRYR